MPVITESVPPAAKESVSHSGAGDAGRPAGDAPRSLDPDTRGRASRDRALFDAAAERWVRKDLHRGARCARRTRLLQTLQAVPPDADARVLEIGCGAGFAARYMFGRYGSYLGVDHSTRLIELARGHNDLPRTRFERADAESLEGVGPFDLVLMIGVLHHVSRPRDVLQQAAAALRPGGFIAVNEPQPANPLVRLARRARRRVDADYSDEQCELSGRQLRRLLCEAGFTDVRIRPQGLLSTPFAEVPLGPEWLIEPLARAASAADRTIERLFAPLLRPLAWNLVACGRRPGDSEP